MVLAALVGPHLLGPSPLMLLLLAYSGTVALLNLGLLWAVPVLEADGPHWLLSPVAQLACELLAWGGYIFLSGGATNPLISLFLPLVAIGALVLPARQAWLLALAAILGYSFLWRFYLPLEIADPARAGPLHIFGMWLVFVMSALLVVAFVLQLAEGLRRRDRALAEAREQAIRDDWLITLGSQAAAAAHALSTPLASLNILVDDLLDDDRLSPALAGGAREMKAEIRRCKEALGQLTAHAGQVSGGQHRQTRVGDWLRGLVLAAQCRHSGVDLRLDLGPGLDQVPLVIDIALEQALSNLLENPVKAGASRVWVKASRAGLHLDLRISDDGPGLPPQILAALGQRRPVASSVGLGVGLMLGRAAIERRGGRLELRQSEAGQGTVAQVRLLLATATEGEYAS
jgi:two-component system sensor histidine kinase RegB